jgi:hypothetical protein
MLAQEKVPKPSKPWKFAETANPGFCIQNSELRRMSNLLNLLIEKQCLTRY